MPRRGDSSSRRATDSTRWSSPPTSGSCSARRRCAGQNPAPPDCGDVVAGVLPAVPAGVVADGLCPPVGDGASGVTLLLSLAPHAVAPTPRTATHATIAMRRPNLLPAVTLT